MFHRIKTLRMKLMAIFLISVAVPLAALLGILYLYFSQTTMSGIMNSVSGTLQTLSTNVEIYLEDLETITLIPYINDNVMAALRKKAKYIGAEIPVDELYEINQAFLTDVSLYFQLMRRDISDLLILPVDGSVYLVSEESSRYLLSGYDYWEQDWYQEAMEAGGSAVYIGNHNQDYIWNAGEQVVFSVARQIRDIETQEVLAVILADTKTSVLETILNSVTFEGNSYCVILDGSGNAVCSNRELPENLPELLSADMDEASVEGYVFVSEEIEKTGWQVAALLDRDALTKEQRLVYLFGTVAMLLYLLTGSLLFAYVSRSVTQPISRLSGAMKEVQNGDFHVVCPAESNDEIGLLTGDFNAMVSQINQLIEKEYKAEIARKDMEYYALQSQIHPHFIYNVLNNLIGLNRTGEKETLEKIILSLTDILRYMQNHQDMVLISQELEIVEKYCALQKLRFGSRMEYIITCEEEYDSFRIPKLLLQPLVENAILHGIEPMGEGGLITLMGEGILENGMEYLLFTVTDNGVGFEVTETIWKSVGLGNIRNRLYLVFPEATFDIESCPGSGTTVKVKIPGKELRNEDPDC